MYLNDKVFTLVRQLKNEIFNDKPTPCQPKEIGTSMLFTSMGNFIFFACRCLILLSGSSDLVKLWSKFETKF